MATANYVLIDGKAYSLYHPIAQRHIAQQHSASIHKQSPRLANQAKGSVPDSLPAVLGCFKGDCSGQTRSLLNKTEARWRDVLIGRGYGPVWEMAIRLKLAHHTTFLPDFAVMRTNRLTFYEVKGGFIREDAWIKLKLAAHLYPEFDFVMAQWTDMGWVETEIPK